MTPIEFGGSRSKVKVTVTFKLRVHICFTNYFVYTNVVLFMGINSLSKDFKRVTLDTAGDIRTAFVNTQIEMLNANC